MRERGEKRPKLLRWAEAAAHSAPSHTAETRLSDRLYSGVKATWVPWLPVSPPTEPHLGGACSSPAPHGLLSQPYGHSEIGSRAPLFHPVGQAGILRIMSSVGLCCKGQEGPWCAISGELDPTAFPFQRALFEGWGQDGGHSYLFSLGRSRDFCRHSWTQKAQERAQGTRRGQTVPEEAMILCP